MKSNANNIRKKKDVFVFRSLLVFLNCVYFASFLSVHVCLLSTASPQTFNNSSGCFVFIHSSEALSFRTRDAVVGKEAFAFIYLNNFTNEWFRLHTLLVTLVRIVVSLLNILKAI